MEEIHLLVESLIMLSKEEQKQRNIAFWTRFKSLVGKHRSDNGQKITWVNYPTGTKQLYVRLTVNQKLVRFAVEIQDNDIEIRNLIWEQFLELKKVWTTEMGSKGEWDNNAYNQAGQPIHRIAWTLEGVNMFDKNQEKEIIQFLIEKLRAFDRFYNHYGELIIHLLK